MDCEMTRTLLDGYLDDELDVVNSTLVEHHLQSCHTCADAYQSRQLLQAACRQRGLYHPIPSPVRQQVLATVYPSKARWFVFEQIPWRATALIATAACFVLLLWIVGQNLRPQPERDDVTADLIGEEILDSHVRSLMVDHLADVASSDQHTVKPWFNGKLDFSPPTEDLANVGFPLLGGRLDYLNGRPVAALVYGRQRHIINVFVWPATQTDEPTQAAVQTRQGYHLIHWSEAAMTYWAVSDLNLQELNLFVQQFQQRSASP